VPRPAKNAWYPTTNDRRFSFARGFLHELAWHWRASEPATLDYFTRDYVGHLHHLAQALP
jgi:hypothetical protein